MRAQKILTFSCQACHGLFVDLWLLRPTQSTTIGLVGSICTRYQYDGPLNVPKITKLKVCKIHKIQIKLFWNVKKKRPYLQVGGDIEILVHFSGS